MGVSYIIIAGMKPARFLSKGGSNLYPGVRIERRSWGYYVYLQEWIPLPRGIQILKHFLSKQTA